MGRSVRTKILDTVMAPLRAVARRVALWGTAGRAVVDQRPFLEVQYHPHNIRQGVRYLFLTRRQVAWIVLGSAVYLAFVVFSLAVAPTVIGNRLAMSEYQDLVRQRTREGDRLKALVVHLAELEKHSDEVRIEMSKIYLAYGFSEDGSLGKGGYPHEPAKVPHSIYAASIRRGNGLHARITEQLGVLSVFLDEVQSFEESHREQVETTPSISPLRGQDFVLTSPFGTRTSPFTKEIDFHAGIDLAAAVGTPIHAPAGGVVAFAGRYPLRRSVGWWRYGNLVALRNGDRFITLFGHCDEIKVRAGQKVRQGDVIGTVGNTGWSTNPHLHYEVRRLQENGEFTPIDPRIYILDHRWRDEERLLIRARNSPDARGFEPLPRILRR
ncbi:MAG: M23 family metallopeptidase [bacterium]|nr:M23 family metallopeptidase [bacterium]